MRRIHEISRYIVARLGVERGATAVEYGLMVALIAAVIIAAVYLLGQKTSETFQCVAEEIGTPAGKGC